MYKLNIYTINEKYIRYLKKYDKKVPECFDKKSNRPFIGIILNINNILYFAPFTSPKRKHLKMKNKIDFLKIDNGKLGAINFNNMIPVPFEECEKLDIYNVEEKYKMLLFKQIRWCNKKKNVEMILLRAKNLYNKRMNNKLPQNIINRCCNFKFLEEKSIKYKK